MKKTLIATALSSALVSLALAGDASLGCFTRTYDRSHLARHPDQLVTHFRLRVYRPPAEVNPDYWFAARFRLRGRDDTLRTGGYCTKGASGISCVVECDGGGVRVVPRADHAMVYLERIRVAACGDDVIDGGEGLMGGKDDRVFRLDRVDDAKCARMEQ
jgi:hypothetical protein